MVKGVLLDVKPSLPETVGKDVGRAFQLFTSIESFNGTLEVINLNITLLFKKFIF